MKHLLLYIQLATLVILSSCTGTRHLTGITQDELTGHVRYLSSDKLTGRSPGTEGDILSREYIRKELLKDGLAPFTGNGLQMLLIPASSEAGPSNRLVINGTGYVIGKDFTPLSVTANASLSAGVVFAGYGFDAVNGQVRWNDYTEVDVKGKWVMLLRGFPEKNPGGEPWRAYSTDLVKALTAKDKGAAGVLLVSGKAWDPDDMLVKLSKEAGGAGIPVIQVRRDIADMIIRSSGNQINDLEEKINTTLSQVSFDTGISVDASAEVLTTNTETANVAMKLEGTSLRNEYVIVGAHFDHLGYGGPGSGSRIPDTVAVHHGADDNASGVALMLELAEKLAKENKNLGRTIVFVAFTAEEKGLLGSKYFVENMGIKPQDVNLMVNLDMIGRMKDGNGLQLGGVGTAAGMTDSIKFFVDTTLLSLSFTPEGYGPSDHTSFYGKEIPVLFVTTGAHLDYHTPADTWDKLNYQGMMKVGDLVYDIVTHAANQEARYAFREAGPKVPAQGMRNLKVTLGIMPDFAGNVKNGLRADFVTPGKPAYQGGMKKGDIIVAIDNKPVNNIEEYMFRLSQLERGQTITVDVIRNGVKEVLLIQL